jgi:hypothetical protein
MMRRPLLLPEWRLHRPTPGERRGRAGGAGGRGSLPVEGQLWGLPGLRLTTGKPGGGRGHDSRSLAMPGQRSADTSSGSFDGPADFAAL